MNKQKIKENAEIIALSNFLSAFPDNLKYEEILELLKEHDLYELDDRGINVWCPFESHSPCDVAGYIQDLYDSIVYRFETNAD